MLEYNRVDLSTCFHINKTDGSRECITRHYLFFLEINYESQPELYNGCHDLVQKAISFIGFPIGSVKRNDYTMIKIYIYYKLICFITKVLNIIYKK